MTAEFTEEFVLSSTTPPVWLNELCLLTNGGRRTNEGSLISGNRCCGACWEKWIWTFAAPWTRVRSHYKTAGESEKNLIRDFPQDMKNDEIHFCTLCVNAWLIRQLRFGVIKAGHCSVFQFLISCFNCFWMEHLDCFVLGFLIIVFEQMQFKSTGK